MQVSGNSTFAAEKVSARRRASALHWALPSDSQAGFSFLARDCDAQDQRFRVAFKILADAIAAEAFPGCSVAVIDRGKLVAQKALGRFTYDQAAPEVLTSTIFDLASVTKVVATTAMAMILYERGVLDLEAPVAAIVPEFGAGDARRCAITLRMLLAHDSGLPAYEKLFLRAQGREELLAAAYAVELTADPGTRAEYSDVGFIILGVALERLADEALDRFCQREVFGPLAMSNTTFNPAESLRERVTPTANDQLFRHRIVQGEVQDENASVLGGVAGHAGAFSTCEDVARFAFAMLNGGQPILRADTVGLFTHRQDTPNGTSRALGWDTPSLPSQSGRHFSARSFGHLGYTGTSLWIDPDRQVAVVLLTNRTWPDCTNQAIKQVRPAFHDAVIEALEKNP